MKREVKQAHNYLPPLLTFSQSNRGIGLNNGQGPRKLCSAFTANIRRVRRRGRRERERESFILRVLLLLSLASDWSYLLAGFNLRASVRESDHEIIDKLYLSPDRQVLHRYGPNFTELT